MLFRSILGAAKSGTTSLYHYISQHPDVFMSRIKEPTFFCDLQGGQCVKDAVRYFGLFDEAGKEKVIGEASHAYLSNPASARILKALFPYAKFVIILRNPADRAYSLYHHMRRAGFEKANSFEKALVEEEWRVRSQDFKSRCNHYYYNYLYFRSGCYGEQIDRYFSLFSETQFLILTLDQLKESQEASIGKIFRFLDVSDEFVPDFKTQNMGSKTSRFPLIQYYWRTRLCGIGMLGGLCGRILNKINVIDVLEMNSETREKLLLRYEPDLARLRESTGITFKGSI